MSCMKCSESSLKTTERTVEEKKKLNKRLKIIEGQIRGIEQMIEEDRYCDDVLMQVAAVNNALKSLGNSILENHLKTCVKRDIKAGEEEILDDFISLVKKLQ